VVDVAGTVVVAVGFLPRRRAHAAKPLELRIRWFISHNQRLNFIRGS
jgi:hypothetical protein